MVEALFKDLIMDKRYPKVRLRLDGEDSDWYGVFVAINQKSSYPSLGRFEAWTKEDYEILEKFPGNSQEHSDASGRCKDMDIASDQVIDMEILTFLNPTIERPKGKHKPKINPELEWVYNLPTYGLDTLSKWDLVKYKLIRRENLMSYFKR